MTKCKGEVGALGNVQLETPSPTPGLYITEVILEVMIGLS